MIRAAAALALCLFLTACGGGSGGNGGQYLGPLQPNGPYRAQQVVYYMGCVTSLPATAPHVNTFWASAACGPTGTWHVDLVGELIAAKAAGIEHIVIALPHPMIWTNRPEIAFQLQRVNASGAAKGFKSIGVSHTDEPNYTREDLDAKSDAEVTAANIYLRTTMDGLSDFQGAHIVTIYACSKPGRPGLTTSNGIGCDDYNRGCGVTGAWDDLYNAMGAGQYFMTVIGGASPWKQNPRCLLDWASHKERVRMHVYFRQENTLRRDGSVDNEGIGTNGMAKIYCGASWDVLRHNEPAMCQ